MSCQKSTHSYYLLPNKPRSSSAPNTRKRNWSASFLKHYTTTLQCHNTLALYSSFPSSKCLNSGNSYTIVVERVGKRESMNMTDSPIQLSPESELESKCAYELQRDQNIARMAVALELVFGATKALWVSCRLYVSLCRKYIADALLTVAAYPSMHWIEERCSFPTQWCFSLLQRRRSGGTTMEEGNWCSLSLTNCVFRVSRVLGYGVFRVWTYIKEMGFCY